MKKKQIKKALRKAFKTLKKLPYKKFLHQTLRPIKASFKFLGSSWHILSGIIFAIVFLYYPIGSLLIEKINNDTAVEINIKDNDSSATIDTMALLINSEVNQSFWTPSLPFIFPSYVLDNMPNYQLGKISAVAKLSKAFDAIINYNQDNNLSEAAKLLQYPGTIWMFSPENRVTPAPSAASQYKRARKELLKYNERLSSNIYPFPKKAEDLSVLIKIIHKDLDKSINDLEKQIRENSSSTFDFKADDIFYYNQGKIYSYYMLLKALGYDYKDIIVSHQIYPEWTIMLKALEDGAGLNPCIVRNAPLNSAFSANHLQSLAYFHLKASNRMQTISSKLETPLNQGN